MGEAALILEADNADEERSNQMTARPCQERAYCTQQNCRLVQGLIREARAPKCKNKDRTCTVLMLQDPVDAVRSKPG